MTRTPRLLRGWLISNPSGSPKPSSEISTSRCPSISRASTRYYSEQDKECVEGVLFLTTDGTSIVNYPKQHSENMTRKHQATSEWLKPTVRIFKNIRNRLIRDGTIKSGLAPSYFIEGMLYNVPVSEFGVSYANTVEKCWGWLNKPPDAGALMCANGIHPLVRDNTHTSWPIQRYLDFLAETQKLWVQWK